MKEVREREQLTDFLQAYQLESVFNEQLTPYLSLYSFEQGEIICSQGDVSEFLYVLVQGQIKIYTTSEDGKTLVISLKTALEVIGDIEYIRDIELINTVEAATPVYMIGVRYRWLRKYGSHHAPLLQFLLDIITRKFFTKSHSMSFNLMHPVEVRVASYLLSVPFEPAECGCCDRLNILNLTDIANLIGTSYRHLNRVIRKLGEKGLIERKNGFIIIKDRDGLTALANP
ncbi:Crp/Fnr family transcriptional regulator [Paenibacillus sp. P96]|uniref:Crp/Fnr family transcriptional regulator n=1 Tax=Paenibacillus zeirhizosphaerae TaxID=2987519 RepID=A0ABT9FR50_9BACL|nr:Crp/Fnr family transcriptional regulator [Paenibacillus sp. P96]MDP4097206.1 Crp/Fnr family transcriptional regulator [Paenibacillus sp. P96]